MNHVRRYRFLGAASAIVLAGALGGALPASAKKTPVPKLKASPSKKLANNQSVSVSGTHFTPGDSVYLLECVAGATSEAGCDPSTITGPITISSKGVLGTTSFTVVTGTVGTGTCGTTKANAKACVINAGDAAGNDTGTAKIDFNVPKG